MPLVEETVATNSSLKSNHNSSLEDNCNRIDLSNLQEHDVSILQKIDEYCTQLHQNGKYKEALEYMEKGLVLRQHFFGSNSDEVWNACKTVGEMCNLLAMAYLQQENFPIVLELLKKAEILSERDPPSRAVTLNNLACYHRRCGHLHDALTNLTHALKIESKLDNITNRADTHLNMCAVLSQLGRHQGALEHAQSALILLHEEIFADGKEESISDMGDRVAVLAIAYHNVAVEQEFLKKVDASIQSYKKGIEIAEKYLGSSHGLVITLKKSLQAAKGPLIKDKMDIPSTKPIGLKTKKPNQKGKKPNS